MPLSQIVVVADATDPHVPLVGDPLKARWGEELIVLDPLQGPLTFERTRRHRSIEYAGRRMDNVKSVWWRKPMAPTAVRRLVEVNVVPERRGYSARALSLHARSLQTSFRSATWVSDYYAILAAENKAFQLELANDLELPTPEAVITSDKGVAAEFIDAHDATIIKPLTTPMEFDPTGERAFFATRVHDSREVNLSQLEWAPAIFQVAIDAIADLRITAVSEEFLTARRDVGPARVGLRGVRDWRADEDHGIGRFNADGPLPAAFADKLRTLMRELRLNFAQIDAVVDIDGNVWFLELNANGNWGFVQDESGLPVGAALADLLHRG